MRPATPSPHAARDRRAASSRARLPLRTLAALSATLTLVAALTVLANGCGPSAEAQEPGRFYAGFWDGFSIKFPAEWEVKENFMGMRVMAVSPLKGSKDRFQENVGVIYERLPHGVTLDEYLNISEQNLFKMLHNVKVLRREDMTIDGFEAKRISFSHSFLSIKLRGVGYVLIKGKWAYVIVCSTTAKSYGSYRRRFDEIAASFRFE